MPGRELRAVLFDLGIATKGEQNVNELEDLFIFCTHWPLKTAGGSVARYHPPDADALLHFKTLTEYG